MKSEPQLIIAGHSGTNILYRGPGTLDEWEERLGREPSEQTYYLTEMSRRDGPVPLIELRSRALLRMLHNGTYQSMGESKTIFPLDRESKRVLLELLNDNETSRQGG